MQLQRMMMGVTMLTINRKEFRLINAGMPSVYLFSKRTNSVTEPKEHGLPVGAMSLSKYKATSGNLQSGDVILLLTDGIPELQNNANEMYGFERIYSGFEKNAEKSSQESVTYLKSKCAGWLNGVDLNDDITFVVIKLENSD